MAPTTLSKDREPDLESYNNFDNASTAGMVHPGDNEKSTRLKRCTSILCSSLGVASILVAYTICGAIVFSNLEGSSSRAASTVGPRGLSDENSKNSIEDNEVVSLGVQEQHQLRVAKAFRQQTVERLWDITEKLNILYKDNWTALADREMVKFQTELFSHHKKAEAIVARTREEDEYAANKVESAASNGGVTDEWSFPSSFLYSLSLITTVGNSKKVPNSPTGKIVAMVVVSLGIPLLLIYLSVMGSGLARAAKKLYNLICCCAVATTRRSRPAKGGPVRPSVDHPTSLEMQAAIKKQQQLPNRLMQQQQHQTSSPLLMCRNCMKKQAADSGGRPSAVACSESPNPRIPVWLCVLLVLCYIFAGASVFCAYHGWTFIDSFFFAFTVLCTIGMMDMMPINSHNDAPFVVLCTLYLLIGLAILAMCANLLQEGSGGCMGIHQRLSTCLGIHQTTHQQALNAHLVSSWVYNETPS